MEEIMIRKILKKCTLCISCTVMAAGIIPAQLPDACTTAQAFTWSDEAETFPEEPVSSPEPSATPFTPLAPNPEADFLLGSIEDEKMFLYAGSHGIFDIDRNNTEWFPDYLTDSLASINYQSSDDSILNVDSSGSYQALAAGDATVYVTGFDSESEQLFEASFYFTIYPDMSSVTLEKYSVTLYSTDGSYTDSSTDIRINSPYVLDEYDGTAQIKADVSNESMFIRYEINDNILTLASSTPGSTDIKLVINGKEFVIHFKLVSVKMSATSLLLTKGKTKQLKVRGAKEKVLFRSLNPKKVSVTASGKIKAKKPGNAIITAQIGDVKLGCAVSVTTAKKKKVIARAYKIAKNSIYDQARRMQSGYYDCSSLVWRSYSPYGCNFGSASYAPVAADLAKWLAGRNKLLKGGFSQKNVQNLKLNAGDLLFETGSDNGRFKGIYHVEIFTGYDFYGFDEKGKPLVITKWANRSDGHYMYGCGIVGKM